MQNDFSYALLTDFYQLTMAYGYWKSKTHEKEAVYHSIFRKNPFGGGYAIASGLERFIEFVETFSFSKSDLDYLAGLKDVNDDPYFSEPFLTYLDDLKITLDIDAVPEGTVIFPQEPMVRIKGTLLQCQLMESPLLNLVNFPTLVATKASRIYLASEGDSILEFGLRRAQGVDGAVTASRAAYVGGCSATSNVLAGKLYGIPVKGTHAHSWVTSFDDETASFEAFADALPGNTVFLVDTFSTIEGVRNAIEVGKKLQKEGKPFLGIRLDSGDLGYLSKVSRVLLDEAGFEETKIFASNELDEWVISELKKDGAKIAVWGVGTKLATAKDQPSLDGVYKMSAIRKPGADWEYKIKLSEQMIKISNPGILQVRRYFNENEAVADMIYDVRISNIDKPHLVDPLDPTREKVLSNAYEHIDLLEKIFEGGEKRYTPPPLEEVRKNTLNNLDRFHRGIKRLLNPHQYVVGMERNIYKKKVELIKEIRRKLP